jgi:hypothetical protein
MARSLLSLVYAEMIGLVPVHHQWSVGIMLRPLYAVAEVVSKPKRLTTEQWLGISPTPLKSVRAFEYRAREGECNAVPQCLGGQQATALLKRFVNEEVLS